MGVAFGTTSFCGITIELTGGRIVSSIQVLRMRDNLIPLPVQRFVMAAPEWNAPNIQRGGERDHMPAYYNRSLGLVARDGGPFRRRFQWRPFASPLKAARDNVELTRRRDFI